MSAIVQRIGADTIVTLDVESWRADVVGRVRAGSRVVTLYGRRLSDAEVLITSVFADVAGALSLTRTRCGRETGYHALTPELPALHAFERELHEQTGLRIAGHPWLKPIRFEGQQQSAMNEFPFYNIVGKEVHEVAVGPIHAGVIEPGSFSVICHRERVLHLEIHLGYQHRGVERRLLEGDPRRLGPLVETIAGDTSVAHASAYCAALERLADCPPLPVETELARAAALELERIAMHLAGLSGMAADVGFLQGATTYGRLRTTAINTTMRLSGSRFGRGAVRPGGIGMRLAPELVDDVKASVALLERDLAIINPCFLEAHTVRHRLVGVGVLAPATARAVGIVGMAARASGVAIDGRQERSVGAYSTVPIASHVFDDGDCWARARVRIAEIDASLAWLARVLEQHPRWDRPRQPIGALAPDTLAVAVVEGWRGEVVHCLETDAGGRLLHYKAQDPSLRNWLGLALAVRENDISDFPICNKSFDLSYCGNDL
jgi:Ni,Fe-hydrogenase III large subunit